MAVNRDVRVEPGANGTVVVVSAWCSKCRENVMPGDDGACLFCKSVIVDEDALPIREMLAQIEERASGSTTGPVVPAPLVSEETPSHAGDGASTSGDTEGSTMPDTNGRAARGAFQRDILGALIAGHTTPVGIGQALGRPGKRVSTTLVQLVAKGFVAKVGYGAYAPTDEGRRMFESGQPLDSLRSGREPRAAAEGPTPVAVSEPPAPPDAEEPSRPENDPEPEPEPLAEIDVPGNLLRELLRALELLDADCTVPHVDLYFAEDDGGGGWDAPELKALFRRLARKEIDGYDLADIGRVALQRIDERGGG